MRLLATPYSAASDSMSCSRSPQTLGTALGTALYAAAGVEVEAAAVAVAPKAATSVALLCSEGEGGGGEGEGGGGNADGGNEDAGNGAGAGDGDGTGDATASTDAGPGSRGVPSPPPRRPSTLSMVCGTPTYFAPELVRLAQQHIGAPEYGPAVDNWAVGCIVYELLTGDPPFLASDEQILFYKILETTPDMPSNVSPLAAELILALMRKEPEERLTCAPAMKYRWLEAGWS
jgi:serine/threonine protein kinase